MTDLVERLCRNAEWRDERYQCVTDPSLLREAAAEIERLRALSAPGVAYPDSVTPSAASPSESPVVENQAATPSVDRDYAMRELQFLGQEFDAPEVGRNEVERLREALINVDGPNGHDWMFPWRVQPCDGKPTIVGHKSGNLFRGYIGTWQEADLIVAAVNALPRLLAALARPPQPELRERIARVVRDGCGFSMVTEESANKCADALILLLQPKQ